jgi:hypothetical protein
MSIRRSLLALALLASPARAQDRDSLRARYLLPVPPSAATAPLEARARMAPGMSASSPTAYGLASRDAFLGASYQARSRYSRSAVDGSVAAGFGLGNPYTLAGLEVVVTSFSTLRSRGSSAGFGDVAGMDLKLHMAFRANFAVAAGWESAIMRNHGGYSDGGSNKFVVLSKWLPLRDGERKLFSQLLLSAGLGNGRFLSETRWAENPGSIAPFGSVALRVAPPLAVVVDWPGQDLMAGISMAPLPRFPLVLNAGLADLLGRTFDPYRKPRLVLSAGVGFRYPWF